jgi:hypothetical protein
MQKGMSMKAKVYIAVSASIFTVVSLVHLLRLTEGWAVQVGSLSLPLWTSMVAVLASAGVAGWGVSLLRSNS